MIEACSIASVRDQFPALDQKVNGRNLVYLDNAATTQTPQTVLDVVSEYSGHTHANVHRGVHTLSQRATDAFEGARRQVQSAINAASESEIIFTKGCTESVNLVAGSWGRSELKPGNELLISTMEHHANLVPWQMIAEQTGSIIKQIPVHDDGTLDIEALRSLLTERTRLVGIKHVCNALGTINPITDVIRIAHEAGALVIVDGAQGLAHQKVDVQALDVDFYTMSSHKTYGPMGVGALYAKRELLDAMPPYQSGGDMIRTVSFSGSTFNVVPHKFEPGTPNVPGVIGFGAALEWLLRQDLEAIARYEFHLGVEARQELQKIPGVTVHGPDIDKVGIVSFSTDFAHPHDIGTVFDQYGVAIRTGHHCCMPLMNRLGVPATARASFAMYNNKLDITVMIEAMQEVHRLFS